MMGREWTQCVRGRRAGSLLHIVPRVEGELPAELHENDAMRLDDNDYILPIEEADSLPGAAQPEATVCGRLPWTQRTPRTPQSSSTHRSG